ncbi:MAG: lytic transglycosylase domain-containing protein [Defluviitaleaceae bacterium]|nr:lytic transglycosylase domain-containing protein [Defluviitaleaceae bacterium]
MKRWLATVVILLILFAIVGVLGLSMRFPVRYLEIIEEHAGDIDPSWILAVIMAESSFRPEAESHRGAQGLMQLMPATAEDIARRMGKTDFDPETIWIPEVNIAMGSFYLNWLLERFGSLDLAIAAYNAGMGNVSRWLQDPEVSSDGQTLTNIPFNETANYVRRVRFNQQIYAIILRFTGRLNRGGV